MATLDWPAGRAFQPRRCTWGAHSPGSAFDGFFSGTVLRTSHLADRMLASIAMPPCDAAEGARREAFFTEVVSVGHLVRMGHLTRLAPRGTLRGAPTVNVGANAGERSVTLAGAVPGATLLAGDPLGIAGQLLLTGYAGAVVDGSGVVVVPLVLPLLANLIAGAVAQWQAPTTTFQLLGETSQFGYGRGAWQAELELQFRQWG